MQTIVDSLLHNAAIALDASANEDGRLQIENAVKWGMEFKPTDSMLQTELGASFAAMLANAYALSHLAYQKWRQGETEDAECYHGASQEFLMEAAEAADLMTRNFRASSHGESPEAAQ